MTRSKVFSNEAIDLEKEKARVDAREAGLLTNVSFLSAHFASLAIWCVRRDTFRLALFL